MNATIISLPTKRNAIAVESEPSDILSKLDEGTYYAATLCITDRNGERICIEIRRSSDLVKALLRSDQ